MPGLDSGASRAANRVALHVSDSTVFRRGQPGSSGIFEPEDDVVSESQG